MATAGQKLGRYELIAPTSGDRWLARQEGVDKRVEIRIPSGADADAQLAHAREIAQLEHANLARVLDVGEDAGVRYVVTESLDGVSLAELLAVGKRLDELGITRIVADAAEGVDAAHEHADGLVHGGVSPTTIGIGFSGQVKVSALDVTAPGALAYTAPERLDGGAGDARSDVFSLGVVLWEALTHERLFDGTTDAATRRMVRELQIESPAMLNANVPAPLADACMKALAQDPEVRFPSAKQLAVELESVLTQAGYSRRNELIASFLLVAFADRAATRKRKNTLQPDTVAAVAPVAAAAPVPAPAPPIVAAPKLSLNQTMTLPLGTVTPAVKPPATQTMTLPIASVRPASPSTPPVSAQTLQMPALAEAVKAEPAPVPAPEPPKPAAPTIADLPTAKLERPTAAQLAAPIATAAEPPAPDPAAVVALVDRPSMDVIGGWAWKTDSVAAIRDDELDEPEPPPNRKPLLYAFGGAVALAAILVVVALASGGSGDDDAPKKKQVVVRPIEPAPIAVAIVVPADADPALTAPDAAPPPPDAPEPDAAPPPPDAPPPPPDAPPPPPPDAAPPPVAIVKPIDKPIDKPVDKPADKPIDKPKKPVDKPKPPVVAAIDKPRPPADKPKKPKGPKAGDPAKPVDPYDKPEFDVAAANRTGLQQFARGDTAGALSTLRGSLASNPTYAPTWRTLGLIFQKLGERDQARAAFKRYLQLAPGADDAEQIRGRLEQLGA